MEKNQNKHFQLRNKIVKSLIERNWQPYFRKMNILMVGLFTNNSFDGDETIAHGFQALGHSVKINYRATGLLTLNYKTSKTI